jgi:hypothetical protein
MKLLLRVASVLALSAVTLGAQSSVQTSVVYQGTGAGIQCAISTALASGSKQVYLPCGTTDITSTISLTSGGFALIGCGSGGNNTGSTQPATLLQWTGSCGSSDVINVLGTLSNRLDKIIFENMIVDAANCARSAIRMEKIDTAELHNVKVRNGATTSFYEVDATGTVFYNVDCGVSPSYCFVFDFGTGGFQWYGGGVENDDVTVTTSACAGGCPLIWIGGAINDMIFSGVETDATQTANSQFGGFLQITGYAGNSPFTASMGTPAGGSGAPNNLTFIGTSYWYQPSSVVAAQGADVLVTGGSSVRPSTNIHFYSPFFNGLNIGKYSIQANFTSNLTIEDGNSTGHTVSGASTLNMTANPAFVAMRFVTSGTDVARVTGAGAGFQMDATQGAQGAFALNNNISVGLHLNQGVANTFAGTCTLGTNCNVSFSSSYSPNHPPVCVGTDQTGANPVKSVPTTSGVSFAGTGTDVIAWVCVGNPN